MERKKQSLSLPEFVVFEPKYTFEEIQEYVRNRLDESRNEEILNLYKSIAESCSQFNV